MTRQDLETLFDTLLSKSNGKPVKVLPNTLPPQCFDWAVYWTDALGVPHYPGNPSPFPYPNAYQIYTDFGDFQAKYFDRLANTPDFIPQKGDIAIWDGKLNGNIGHVAVCTGEGTKDWFKSSDQNWSPGSPVQIIKHDYKFVLGVLRLKVTQSTTMARSPEDAKYIAQLEKAVNEKDAQIAELNNTIKTLNQEKGDEIVKRENIEKDITDAGLDPQDVHNSLNKILADTREQCQTTSTGWLIDMLGKIWGIILENRSKLLQFWADVRKKASSGK